MTLISLLAPQPMHIPDGFLSVLVSIVLWILSTIVIAVALRRANQEMGDRQAPLMGVLAAAIFAGQMLNFTVAGGTSGHLMGAAIATILLGPWAAILVMTTVVGVQALIFQDGGLLVLGANIFNMGIVGVAVSYFVFTTFRKLSGGRSKVIYLGGYLAAWSSIVIAALSVALQLTFSGTSPANIAVPTMGAIHALIGIGEGLITVGALVLIQASRPDLLQGNQGNTRPNSRLLWIAGLLIALVLAVASPLASTNPDGLEWVAEKQGFLQQAQGPIFQIIPDYLLPGVSNQAAATIAAGVIGVFIVLGVFLGLAVFRRLRAQNPESNQT